MRRDAAGWNSPATADLVFGDCGEFSAAPAGRPTRRKRSPPISYPVNADIACVWWAFNTAEGWACDGSADIARQVLARARELDD